ncbi:MAG: hypothetical protein F4Y47_06025 [Acidobacteriia bacterium]|nr:hypothetical protein [Terriglobia bacterium]MYG01810.1 hypothetical protein [Terriglobia bacterium]MYK08450.1 hypothetical protein [Terriglobia bacterium]
MSGNLGLPVLTHEAPYTVSPGTEAGPARDCLMALTAPLSPEAFTYRPMGEISYGMRAVEAGESGVFLRYESMERGRPYPVNVEGYWIIAVLHHGASQATLYRVPDDG